MPGLPKCIFPPTQNFFSATRTRLWRLEGQETWVVFSSPMSCGNGVCVWEGGGGWHLRLADPFESPEILSEFRGGNLTWLFVSG